MSQAYITKTAHFLPNRPVSNEDIEKYLGKIGEKSSRAKSIVLRNNKIKNRHYAIDDFGKITHSNAEMACEAINQLFDDQLSASDIELLAVGTSIPDVLIPSHGLLVHSLMKGVKSIPVYSTAGVCCSSMHALEIAYLSLLQGKATNAIASGSELVSPLLRSEFFEIENSKLMELNDNASVAFEKDFLRFMLSDGSGAFLLQNKPRAGLNFKIEWIESISYANELPYCMYAGCSKTEEGRLVSWKEMSSEQWSQDSIFSIKQDTRILENIVPKAIEFLKKSLKNHQVSRQNIDHFLPHISSMYFYEKMIEGLKKDDLDLSEDVFYCCLPQIGNIGSASIYATLDLLTREKEIKHGEKIMLGVPESAKFQYSFAYLTAEYY